MIGRMFWVGVNTAVEMYKDRSVTGFLAVGIVLIIGGFVVADMSVVEKKKMFIDTGMAAIFMVSAFITMLAGSNVIDREVRNRQVLCTLSKPMPRYAWFIGKSAGFVFTLGVVIFVLTVFLFVFVRINTHFWMPAIFVGGLLIYLEMLIISSYTLLFSTVTGQYLTLFLSMCVLIIGHMVADLKIYWASGSAFARLISKALFYILPNLESFLASPVVLGKINIPPGLIGFMLLYTLGYLAAGVIIAAVIMNRRELV